MRAYSIRGSAGLNAGVRQAAIGWATVQRMQGANVELSDIMGYLRVHEQMNATPATLAGKGERNTDMEPMDIGAVTTRSTPQPRSTPCRTQNASSRNHETRSNRVFCKALPSRKGFGMI